MTTGAVDWMHPPQRGWTYEQAKKFDLPFEWELVDGAIVVRGMTDLWHNTVRDELLTAVRAGRQAPCGVVSGQCVLVDEYNPVRPDVVVFDPTGVDVMSVECLPVESVRLAVEVVSPASPSDDRFRRPGMYAEVGIEYFSRVERGTDNEPFVFEFALDHASGVYAPPPSTSAH